MKVNFYSLEDNIKGIKYVVIQASYQGKWIFVRHMDRRTWEIPGGHIEHNETYEQAAKRELWEETGATKFKLLPLCYYAVERDGLETFGVLHFAEVEVLEALPEHEIVEILFSDALPKHLTYLGIQPFLFEKVVDYIENKGVNSFKGV